MKQPTVATVKRLFSLSGNRCAFPKCPLPNVDADSGKVTGRVSHIKAARPNGPRYDREQPDEERHGFLNLLILCPIHHDVVDSDVESYTVERLIQIKADHESANAGTADPPIELVEQLIALSNVVVAQGSILLAINQAGGQIAHSITNVFNQELHQSAAATAKLREKRVEVYGEIWQLLLKAQGPTYQLGYGVGPVPNLNNIPYERFLHMVENSKELTVTEKVELIQTKDRDAAYAGMLWRKQRVEAREAWRSLHNYANANRIYLPDSVRAAVTEAAALLSKVIVRIERAATGKEVDFEATTPLLEQLEKVIGQVEALFSAELAGA